MAKVGYIYNTPHANGLTEDGEWMRYYGCVQVAEEAAEDERFPRCGSSSSPILTVAMRSLSRNSATPCVAVVNWRCSSNSTV